MSVLKVVVVGNGMVGHHFVTTLAKKDLDVEIIVLGEEPRIAYDRVHLSEVFAGREASDLALASLDTYAELGITTRLGDPVVSLDRETKVVVTQSGARFNYDMLVLATGSYPFVPQVPGADHPRCLEYRTIEDLEAIKSAALGSKRGVVVGGGLLGLECANALQNLGLDTHVVEFAPGLMSVQLDAPGSQQLRTRIEGLGITVHTSKNTTNIKSVGSKSLRMEFADDSSLNTDLIVFSAGIRPRDD